MCIKKSGNFGLFGSMSRFEFGRGLPRRGPLAQAKRLGDRQPGKQSPRRPRRTPLQFAKVA
jgi:hypothetical protein